MGSWGTGPFGNDAAGDFLSDLKGSPTRSITQVLKVVAKIPDGHHIDVDDASAAWAACELVAMSFGYTDPAVLDGTMPDLAGRLKPNEEQRLLAQKVVPRIAAVDASELAALWHEADSGDDFDRQIRGLSSRLEAASAGPKPILRPKSGDIVFLPNSPGSTDGLVLQVLSSSEVAVFEGIVSDDAAGGLAGRAGESFSVGPE